MTKTLIFISTCFTFACTSQTAKKAPASTLDKTVSVVKYETATEELAEYFEVFSINPILSQAFDSIKSEYPAMLRDIAFLKSDSVKGLNIDCIGVYHLARNHQGGIFLHDSVRMSQKFVEETIKKERYDFIGTEISTLPGRINFDDVAKQDQSDYRSLTQIMGTTKNITFKESKKSLMNFAQYDYSFKLLVSNTSRPYLIGTEPRWVYLTEQLMMATVPWVNSINIRSHYNLISLLGKVRSEISYARTARHLIKVGREKRAVIVYGELHLVDYKKIQQKYGTVGKIISSAF